MKTTDEQILSLIEDFKKFMHGYLEQQGVDEETDLDYLAAGFDQWWVNKNWQVRNDKAWELAKASVKKAGFYNM